MDPLETAVEAAVAETPAEMPTETPVVEAPAETPVEETPVETTVETTPAVEAPAQLAPDVQRAVDFFQALSDPNTAPQMVEFLASKLGLQVSKPKSEAAAAPTISQMIAESLGEEYGFIAPKLGPAVERAIQAAMAPLQEQLLRTQISSEFSAAMADLNTETKGDFKNFEQDIAQAMRSLKPADGVPTKQYLSDLYALAKAKKSSPAQMSAAAAKAVVQKMTTTAKGVLPPPSAAPEARVTAPRTLTLDEALDQAIRSLK